MQFLYSLHVGLIIFGKFRPLSTKLFNILNDSLIIITMKMSSGVIHKKQHIKQHKQFV